MIDMKVSGIKTESRICAKIAGAKYNLVRVIRCLLWRNLICSTLHFKVGC